MTQHEMLSRYPKTVTSDDGKKIEIRAMTAKDRDAILDFARQLPEEDLLFLRVDLTEPAVVDEWVANLERGLSTSLLAYEGRALAGYATVHVNPARWTRRVGEIRVNVGPAYRAKGLGRNLTAQIFDLARALGLKKLTATMTMDQTGAQAAFRRLGFVPEAVLADYVEDRKGVSRDLVIMCYDIDGLTEQMDEPLQV
jgi:RimJ/RimL family protein N-acetyltransferase